jgi:cupin 2 domain-containing protein
MDAALLNLLAPLPAAGNAEIVTALLQRPGIRIERIVSRGQITPAATPYDQPYDEWVLLLAGAARLWLADRGEIALAPGDALLVPAHVRHGVTYTQAEPATIWLAIHLGGD